LQDFIEKNMSSEYDAVPRTGSLKLKKTSSVTIKKKKRKEDKKVTEGTASTAAPEKKEEDDQEDIEVAIEAKMRERNPLLNKTKHELRYLQNTARMQEKRVMNKASKTHKMRVEEFNRHLDNLTEHFDIPKVSWTK